MVYTLKFKGKKYAYDSATGAVVNLPSLPFKMIEALEPPLEPLCPTSLRYELAKYDSMDVSDAYESILEYANEGILYGADDGVIRLMTDGEFGCRDDSLVIELLTKAFAHVSSVQFEAIGTNSKRVEAIAKEIVNKQGK